MCCCIGYVSAAEGRQWWSNVWQFYWYVLLSRSSFTTWVIQSSGQAILWWWWQFKVIINEKIFTVFLSQVSRFFLVCAVMTMIDAEEPVTWSSHDTIRTDIHNGTSVWRRWWTASLWTLPRRQPPLPDIVLACGPSSAGCVQCISVTIGLVDCRLSCAV